MQRAAQAGERSSCWWALSERAGLASGAGFPDTIPAVRIQIVQHLLPLLHRFPFAAVFMIAR
jgi:hypothetical protein